MMGGAPEVLAMWVAVGLYALASIAYIVGFTFGRPRLFTAAQWILLAGALAQGVGILVRWTRVQHGPYLGFYEVVSSYALVGVALFLVLSWRIRGLRALGSVLIPVAFLALGGAMLAPKSDLPITPMLASYWLTVHVSFANLSYGAFITAAGLGVAYLMKSSGGKLGQRIGPPSLSADALDDLAFKFVAAGFIFLGIMIVSGAIWANESWGRYWGWDPIETWSLISWLAYAFIIHLRLTLAWRGRRFAWAAMSALPVLVFALIGVVLVYQSVHAGYLVPR